VEKGDDGAFEFGAAACVDCCGRECLPNYRLADVGRYEEGNSRAETVPFLEKFVEEDDDKRGRDKLDDKEKADKLRGSLPPGVQVKDVGIKETTKSKK